MNSSRMALIAFAALVGSAFAQGPPPGGSPRGDRPPPRDGMGGRHGERDSEMWKKADTDGDGFISFEEFSAMERPGHLPEERRKEIFDRLDKNGDGKIGPDELPVRPPGGMPSLEEVDADKDGRIVFEEFQKLGFVARLPEDRQRELFNRMDRDGDGALTPKDRPEGPPRGPEGRGRRPGGPPPDLVRMLDEDGDGVLSFEEFRKSPFLRDRSEEEQKKRFEELDKNGDLKLDAAELAPPDGPPRFPGGPRPPQPRPGAPESSGTAPEPIPGEAP